MPIYEYKCEDCGSVFEELVYSTDKKIACPDCGKGSVEKLMSVPGGFLMGNSSSATPCGSSSCASASSCAAGGGCPHAM